MALDATQIVQKLSEDLGFKGIKDATATLAPGVAIGDKEAIKTAGLLISNLTLKVLQQEIWETKVPNKYEAFLNKFYKGELVVGNTIEFLFPIITGGGDFIKNDFIPTDIIEPKHEFFHIDFYKKGSNEVLEDGSYRYRKQIVLVRTIWTQYFISGKLNEFLAKIINDLKTPITLFLYKQLVFSIIKKINDSTNARVKFEGAATDNFLAWTDDIYPRLEEFKWFGNEYNIDPLTYYPSATSNEDIIIFMSPKTYTSFKNGTLSQLFNPKAAELGNFITESNIHILEKEIIIRDENTPIEFGANIIDDNTIYFFDKNMIFYYKTHEAVAEQKYALNLAEQHVFHFWGKLAIAPQMKALKYTNINLNKAPGA